MIAAELAFGEEGSRAYPFSPTKLELLVKPGSLATASGISNSGSHRLEGDLPGVACGRLMSTRKRL